MHIALSKRNIILLILVWSLTLCLTWLISSHILQSKESTNLRAYHLLNPRLQEIAEDQEEAYRATVLVNLQPLREELIAYLGDRKDNAAFFVESLNTGARAMWQEREQFIPASLLKVPLAIAVMKKVESKQWDLDATTFAIEERYKDRYFGSLWQAPNGTAFTVRHLLEEMLQYSDNTATNTLYNNIEPGIRDDIYYHIGLVNPEAPFEVAANRPLFRTLTARDLVTFFRALYNSTYITRASSEHILSVLTETKFDKVVSTEIPETITVAHKVANFFTKDPNRPKNYHDCGIVYYPERPYLFCYMTRNLAAEDAQELIVEMGARTYRFFASQ